MKLLKIITGIVIIIIILVFLGGLYINLAFPNVGAPPDITIVPTSQRLLRGKYLANHVAVCMDCHSYRDWNRFSGPLVDTTLGGGGQLFDKSIGFPGKIYASNITPHALANWSDGEILKAITTGENKHGEALFPIMAYKRYGKMDQEDLYSIIAYIRSITPIVKNTPKSELDFPINLISKTLPSKPGFQMKLNPKDTLRHGAYLVNAAGCMDCHSKSDKGKIIVGTEFGGGMQFKFEEGTLTAPNITMHKTRGIGHWTKEMFVSRFKSYAGENNNTRKVGKTIYNTPMPWVQYAGMTESDLEAIFTYISSLKPNPNKVVARTFK